MPPRSGSARPSRAARPPTVTRSPVSRPTSTAAGERIKALDAELAEVEAALDDQLLRIPNPADPDIPVGGEEANVTIRTWGEQLPHEQPLEGEVGADAPRRRRDLDPQAPLGARRDARHPRQRPRRQDRRLRLPGLQGRRIRPPARPDQLVPRRPHPRARLHRGLAAGRRQRRLGPRHRADPGQGRPDVRRDPRRALPGPHGRGPGHQPPPRRDLRGRRPADPLCGLLAVLPARGGRGRARTRAGSSASTSSTRSRWSCSSGPRTRRRPSSG